MERKKENNNNNKKKTILHTYSYNIKLSIITAYVWSLANNIHSERPTDRQTHDYCKMISFYEKQLVVANFRVTKLHAFKSDFI